MRNPDSQTRRRDSVRRANRAIVASWSEHLAPLRPHAIDAGLAVVVAVAVAIAISVTYERGAQSPDALAYALGVTIGALVLARRRSPLGVLVASVVTLQVYYFANYPGIQPAVALAVALYTAAAAGYLRWSLVIAAWCWVPPVTIRGLRGSGTGSAGARWARAGRSTPGRRAAFRRRGAQPPRADGRIRR
jgi:hypothetical protein